MTQKIGVFKTGFCGPKMGGSLGIVTKNSSPRVQTGLTDTKTGEFFETDKDLNGFCLVKKDPAVSRAERWALTSIARKLLPQERVSKCMVLRTKNPFTGGLLDIEICKSERLKKAFYHGLMSCGRVWHCPICAAKISEKRRVELKNAIGFAKEKKLGIHFVTLTFPHGISDDLEEITKMMSKAYGKLSSGKHSIKMKLKNLNPNNTFHGFIRAVEVTHGKNGFHPHVHMIVITDGSVTRDVMQCVYCESWMRACRLAGLPIPSKEHGCTVKDGSFASDYVSKWGLEEEMTKANQKKTKSKGMTPWGLLKCVLEGDDSVYTPEYASNLFRVYARVFKGKRQLFWSVGLRKFLSLGSEASDQELADGPDDEQALVLATLTPEEWKIVRHKKQQANLLSVAESNPLMIKKYIKSLA